MHPGLPIAAAGAAVLVVLTPILTVASSTAAYVAACQSPADSGDFNGVDAVDLASFQGTPLGGGRGGFVQWLALTMILEPSHAYLPPVSSVSRPSTATCRQ